MEHFTHPGHSLAEVYGSEEFQCDGCKTPGNGLRYRCHTCDFNMHDYCGRCPSTLSTFMHPQHHLKLVIGTQGRHDNEGSCDLCGDNFEGLFYQCTLCDFNIHPLCTKLPEYVPHALDPVHQLKLQTSSSPGWCRVCKSECTSWRYGCRTCNFDIHLECILDRCDASTASRSVAAPASPHGVASPLPPWGWGCSYGGLTDGAYGPAPYGAYGPAPYGAYVPAPHGAYGPSPYYAYGPQHPYYSSTPPPYYPSGPSPTHFGAYVHPYAFTPPPPSIYGAAPPSFYGAAPPSFYGAAPPPFYGAAPPPFHGVAPPPPTYGAAPPPPTYGAAPPPPTYGAAPPPPTYGAAPPPPSYGAYAYGEPPGFSPHSANHSVSEAQGSGKPSKLGKKLGKIIYSLVVNLTIGLFCGVIFG
uniref:DC1 domain-containing protein n=1 Tax=Vitis vinifera TaxID=29760 RepID=A5B045_VITVI|nr:hypothetical protein VITISV_031643 [Vitis vinifera]